MDRQASTYMRRSTGVVSWATRTRLPARCQKRYRVECARAAKQTRTDPSAQRRIRPHRGRFGGSPRMPGVQDGPYGWTSATAGRTAAISAWKSSACGIWEALGASQLVRREFNAIAALIYLPTPVGIRVTTEAPARPRQAPQPAGHRSSVGEPGIRRGEAPTRCPVFTLLPARRPLLLPPTR